MKSFRKETHELTHEQLTNELESVEISLSHYEKRTTQLFEENKKLREQLETALYITNNLYNLIQPTEKSCIDNNFKQLTESLTIQ